MKSENNHNKIITKAAREVLRPRGLFQKGTSRTWIDDNGWFFIVVEFQPSAWEKGSYLNVAINYLWQEQDYLSFDYGHRVDSFASFDENETAFYEKMLLMSNKAMEKVEEYRKFSDVAYAKALILKRSKFQAHSHELYHKMMICGLAKDSQAVKYYKKLLNSTENSALEWELEYRKELLEHIAPLICDEEKLYEYIVGKISAQRNFWRSKPSMKKMKGYLDK